MTQEYVARMLEEIKNELEGFLSAYICFGTTESVMEEIWDRALWSKAKAFIERNVSGDKCFYVVNNVNVGINDGEGKHLYEISVKLTMKEGIVVMRIWASEEFEYGYKARDDYRTRIEIRK